MLKLQILIIAMLMVFSLIVLLVRWLTSTFDPKDFIWIDFKKVLRECEIKTGEDFEHFMSVVGYYSAGADYEEDILKVWKEHKDSIKKAVKRIKKGK